MRAYQTRRGSTPVRTHGCLALPSADTRGRDRGGRQQGRDEYEMQERSAIGDQVSARARRRRLVLSRPASRGLVCVGFWPMDLLPLRSYLERAPTGFAMAVVADEVLMK